MLPASVSLTLAVPTWVLTTIALSAVTTSELAVSSPLPRVVAASMVCTTEPLSAVRRISPLASRLDLFSSMLPPCAPALSTRSPAVALRLALSLPLMPPSPAVPSPAARLRLAPVRLPDSAMLRCAEAVNAPLAATSPARLMSWPALRPMVAAVPLARRMAVSASTMRSPASTLSVVPASSLEFIFVLASSMRSPLTCTSEPASMASEVAALSWPLMRVAAPLSISMLAARIDSLPPADPRFRVVVVASVRVTWRSAYVGTVSQVVTFCMVTTATSLATVW